MTAPEHSAVVNRTPDTLGMRAYVRYCTGVALMNDPTNPSVSKIIDGQCLKTDLPGIIVVAAGDLMYQGLKGLVRAAGQKTGVLEERVQSLTACEKEYGVVYPAVLSFVRGAFADAVDAQRLNALNETFKVVQPLPLDNRCIYTSLCHGRRAKLEIASLLAGYAPHHLLASTIAGRNLSLKGNECRRQIATSV
jgi:hypothetical protein